MKKYLIYLAISLLFAACNKGSITGENQFNPTTPYEAYIDSVGGEIIVTAKEPVSQCAFRIDNVAFYEHEIDENGKHALIEVLRDDELKDINKRKAFLNVGENDDLKYISATFADSNTFKFTVAPCDKDKYLYIDISIHQIGFGPGKLFIHQNE